jgi:hypothetical protein
MHTFRTSRRPLALFAVALLGVLWAAAKSPAQSPDETPGFQGWYRPPGGQKSVEYLIITARPLRDAFRPLAEWKTRKGLPADIVCVEDIVHNPLYRGTDPAESVRNFIIDLYWKWGLDYVVLGGDVNLVPTRMIPYDYGAQAADLYFSALDGTWNGDCDAKYGGNLDRVDHVEDVFVGRVPAENPKEVEIFLQKFFTYIRPEKRDYQTNILLLGAILGNDFNWDADDHYKEIREDFLSKGGFKIIELEESEFLRGKLEAVEKEETRNGRVEKKKTESAYIFGESNGRAGPCDLKHVVKFVNQGVGIMSHIIHSNVYLMGLGKGWIDAGAVKKFRNRERPFVVFSSGCQVNMFNQESISERVFFHPEGGAVAFIGCTVNSYAYQNIFERDFWESLLYHNVYRIGPLLAACKARRNFKWKAPSDPFTIIIRGLNLLGDPEMPVWSKRPGDLTVSHPHSVELRPGKVEVTVLAAETQKPVRDALVCLWKEGEVYARGRTAADGRLSLDTSPRTPGKILVTATARNRMPYEGGIAAKAEGSGAPRTLVVADLALVDKEKGNGNGLIEAGETVQLLLAFQNTTASDRPGARIRVRDAGRYLKVVSGETALGDIRAGAFAIAAKPLVLEAGSEVPPGQRAVVGLSVEQDGETRDEEVVLWLNAPWIVHAGHRIDDGAEGDGIITDEDAGETVRFLVDVSNLGTGAARGLRVELKLRGGEVTVENARQHLSDLPVGSRRTLEPFRVRVGEDYDGAILEGTLSYTDASGMMRKDEFTLEDPPTETESLRATGSVRSVRLSWQSDDLDERIAGFNVYRADGESGAFRLVSPTPVPASCFEDIGLERMSRYRYRVTTVDRSLNESAPCSVASVWTSHAFQRDWPQSARGPVHQVVVTDVDGDADAEIGAGAFPGPWVWHHTGQELRHGGDHWTFGLFKNMRLLTSAPAFADLNGDGKVELLCTGRGGDKKAYVMDLKEAKNLKGWPKKLSGEADWPPQAADLDGDGKTDVLVYCRGDGSLHAFRGDGKPLSAREKIATAGKGATLPPTLVDLDGNGDLEIVGVNADGRVYAFHHDGGVISELQREIRTGENGGSVVAAGDADGDGKVEIFFCGEQGGKLFAVGPDGKDLPGFPAAVAPAGGATRYQPILADLDGDRKAEVLLPAPGRIHAFRLDGSKVDGFPAAYQGNPCGAVVGDIDGDGSVDVVVSTFTRNIFAFHADGTRHQGWPVIYRTQATTPPILTDVDRDGDVDIVLGTGNSGICIWDLPGALRPGNLEWDRTLTDRGRVNLYFPAPAAPEGLSAEPGDGIRLKWNAPADGAAGYHVYRARGDGSLCRITGHPVKETGFADSGAGGGGRFRFAVSAVSARDREGPLSGEIEWEDPAAERILGQGRELETQGKAREAARCFRRILSEYPDSRLANDARRAIGRVRGAAGLEDPAEAALRDRTCESYLALGDSWAKRGLKSKAAACYRKVLDRDPFGPWGEKAQKKTADLAGKQEDE